MVCSTDGAKQEGEAELMLPTRNETKIIYKVSTSFNKYYKMCFKTVEVLNSTEV